MARPELDRLLPPARLGVIGGGQLGRMFHLAASRMGYRTIALAESEDAPAAQVATEVIVGSDQDLRTLRQFAARIDAVTVEFENVSAASIRWLSRRVPTRPDARAIWISQNRLREKRFFRSVGLPTAPWAPVQTERELTDAVKAVGIPLILKQATSGYDGKGQIRVNQESELAEGWERLGCVPCVAEGVVAFDQEISVVVARGVDGSIATFPVGLNHHDRHILDTTLMPAPLKSSLGETARMMATKIAQALDYVGVLCVEFFRSSDQELRVNEMAPRPHNSGHLTIEAAATSQFEQQVRALSCLPLGSTDLLSPAAMANLLGDLWDPGTPDWSAALEADPALSLHLYGKDAPGVGRKMGHLTVLDPDPDTALERVLRARRQLIRE